VDKDNKVSVPPGEPRYSLKRIWLLNQDEEGYYYDYLMKPSGHFAILPIHAQYSVRLTGIHKEGECNFCAKRT